MKMPPKVSHQCQNAPPLRGGGPAPQSTSEATPPIMCPFCQNGHPTYFSYMDHLQNTPCGIRHQNFNHMRNPWFAEPFGHDHFIRHTW